MTDKEICDLVLESGLRGRGGGGFPAGKNGKPQGYSRKVKNM